MKVALINPAAPASLRKENLGLAYLAAALEQAGHRVRIADEIAGDDVDTALDEFRPDVVGISFMTMYAPRAYELADRIRKERGLTIVLGGAHPSAMPEEAMEHADCVIRGEGELSFPRLLDCGRMEGVIEPEPPDDLDALPMPRRDLLNLDFYAEAGDELAGFSYRTLGMITSRGCPFRCNFCVNSKRETHLRFHGPERVIEELRLLVDRYHIESVAFYDELFGTDTARLLAICDSMCREGLDFLRWECQMHPRTVKADALAAMKRAGCLQVAIGFESGSQPLLDRIGKNALVETNLEAARMVRDAGLRLRGCFIIGTPGETREDIVRTEEFIKKARIDFASIHYLTPYPGTALYDEVADRLARAAIPWDRFTTGDPATFNCNDAMPEEEQKALFERLQARLALRNYSLWEMVKRAIRNPHHARYVLSRLLR